METTDENISRPQLIDSFIFQFKVLNDSFLDRSPHLIPTKGLPNTTWKRRKRVKIRCDTYLYRLSLFILLMSVIIGSSFNKTRLLSCIMEYTLGVRCIFPNNYFIWEATRPVTDCAMCSNLTKIIELHNVTREEFNDFAYTSKPVVVRKAAAHWHAAKVLNFDYLRKLFEEIESSYETIEDECQFLTFKTNFLSLREFFNMSESRVRGLPNFAPWYVGWSVCQPDMVRRMRQLYPRPHFLPEDAEHSHLDYVFMGYQQGAVMHLDYISRLMWQAQLAGRKKWELVPPPECDHICTPLTVTVEEGDIFLLDTRQWYHDTYVQPGMFSLSISSEYG